MRRKQYIIILLFLSWMLANIHRAWNNVPVRVVHPCIWDRKYEVSIHWFVHFILKDISYISIFYAIWLYINSNIKKDKDIIFTFGTIFLVQVIDAFHYILLARHSEYVLIFESAIMLASALIIKYKQASKLLAWIRC